MSQLVPAEKKFLEQQSQKVLTNVGPNVKLFFVLSAMLLYVMVITFFSTMLEQMPSRCGEVEVFVLETGQRLHSIYSMDQNLAIDIEHLNDLIADY